MTCTGRAAILTMALAFVQPAAAQYIYVANAGEDTVSKIDISSKQEVARYRTWFGPVGHPGFFQHPNLSIAAWQGPAPSRIAVDAAGNAYVLDRFFSSHLPVLLKINPTLPGPTSTGPTPLDMDDTTGNNDIDSTEIQDKKIEWARNIGMPMVDEGMLGRAVCIDPSGFLWVGIYTTQKYIQVNPSTGMPTGVAVSTSGHSPYGCVVDSKGKLWSVNEDEQLAEIDTHTGQFTIHTHPHAVYGVNYSASLSIGCSGPTKVYMPAHMRPQSSDPLRTYIVYDSSTGTFSNPTSFNPTFPLFESRALAVDHDGNIFSGAITGRVVKSKPDGTVLWDTNAIGSTVATTDLRGLIVDANNDVWAVLRTNNAVVNYSGLLGTNLATVQVGIQPYTYGNVPPPTCPCAELEEKTLSCTDVKGTYAWSATFVNHSPFGVPATDATVSPASPNVTAVSPPSVIFTPPVPLNGQGTMSGTLSAAGAQTGDSVCIDIKLHGGEGLSEWCCPSQQVCFTVPVCPDCARVTAVFKCSHGHRYLEVTVINNGPTTAQSVQIFSTTPGVTITPVLTQMNFPTGVPVTFPVDVNGAAAGQSIDISINVHGSTDPKTGVFSWCCTATIKVIYPTRPCLWFIEGVVADIGNHDPIPGVRVRLTGENGFSRAVTTDAAGAYRFNEIDPGEYRLSVDSPRGWRVASPAGGAYSLHIERPPEGSLDFGMTGTLAK